MAEVPAKKRTRKTTTKKVASKAATATKTVSSASSRPATIKRRGLSLKLILAVILFLFLTSGGAFYVGYSAEGVIDVNTRISDEASQVDGGDGQAGGIQNPPPLKERPILEPANVETPAPVPEPVPETSSDETSDAAENTESTEDSSTVTEDSETSVFDEAGESTTETPSE